MFAGLSAFPLTPLVDDRVDEGSFAALIARLARSQVTSITALGSTGSGAYLSTEERSRVARLAVEHAGSTPVFLGVGALRTSQVLANVRIAEEAGARGVLLAPMSYQPLTAEEVFELFRTVADSTALPVIVYDNPRTTHFTFTTELYGQVAALPGVASIKIPGVPADPARALARVREIRAAIPEEVTIGISGDPFAAAGLNAGCQVWYSVLAGTLPEPATRIAGAALAGRAAEALAASERLDPLWRLFAELGGSLRVIAAVAEHLGLVPERSLPLPLQSLSEGDRARVVRVVRELDLAP